MVSWRRGDGVGDRIDQERHVVVDDADPHPPPARFAAGRFDRKRDFAACAGARDLGQESAASRSSSRVKPLVSPGSALPVSALRNASTSGLARRVWTVMLRYLLRQSAAMAGGL